MQAFLFLRVEEGLAPPVCGLFELLTFQAGQQDMLNTSDGFDHKDLANTKHQTKEPESSARRLRPDRARRQVATMDYSQFVKSDEDFDDEDSDSTVPVRRPRHRQAASKSRQSQKRRVGKPPEKRSIGDSAREAELKKAKSVQSARECRRRKKQFIQSLQLQVKKCQDRDIKTQKEIVDLERTLRLLHAKRNLGPLNADYSKT